MIAGPFHEELAALRQEHGAGALTRIDRFLANDPGDVSLRHPRQQPTRHIVPGLSTRPWLSLEEHPQLRTAGAALQGRHAEIKQEILARIAHGPLDYYRTSFDQRNEKWRSVYLARDGVLDERQRAQFPLTMGLVEQHFREHLYPLGEVFFSALQPAGYIGRHCDTANFFVCLHFSVCVPPRCGLSVAGESRTFQENELYLFDHSYEHEAWNWSPQCRINLLFDLWHPGLSAVERHALAACFRKMYTQVRT